MMTGLRTLVFSAIYNVLFILILTGSAFAESIFLKDGSIVEGKVIKETDAELQVELTDGTNRNFFRKDIIRTIYHDTYKNLKYLNKMDGSVITVYLVDEDKTSYTYRLKLDSPDEVRISKDDVDSISKKKVPVVQESNREENIVTRASRIRVAYGKSDEYPEFTDKRINLYLDIMPYRMRDKNGNGLDFFLRGSLVECQGDYDRATATKIAAEYGYTVPGTEPDVQIGYYQNGLGAGIRYIHGFYLAGILWQGYLSGSVSHLWDNFCPSSKYTYKTEVNSYAGSAGIEIGLFSYFGLFAEATYAYTPAAKNYQKLSTIYFGATLRTSYL